MKKILIFIIGFTPFLAGYAMNSLAMNYNNGSISIASLYDMISIIFFLYWGLLGFLLCRFTKSKIYTAIICNFPAFIVLLLILYQEIINKQYWSNAWGIATQFFYLATLRISYKVQPNFWHYTWETIIVSFLLMSAIFYLGCFIRDKIRPDDEALL